MTPITGRRLALVFATVFTFVLLQLCAVNDISFPVGRPDLPILAVIALALAWGPTWGVSVGFATGLALDLAPPADHAVGQLAFAYAAIGYLAGLVADEDEQSVLVTIVVVVAGCVGLIAVDVALAIVIGDGTVSAPIVGRVLASTVVYDVVLAPFVVPLLSRLARRTEPAGVR
jgi:rod shape-determining protein MreD